jgi:hypothetical protein
VPDLQYTQNKANYIQAEVKANSIDDWLKMPISIVLPYMYLSSSEYPQEATASADAGLARLKIDQPATGVRGLFGKPSHLQNRTSISCQLRLLGST